MGDLVQGISHSLVRIAAFTTKELREVIRRPGALLSLILGPFLVMALFGLGYSGYRAPFATEIVVPAESDFSRAAEDYEDLAPGRIQVTQVSEDREGAEERLRDGSIDLLVVAPDERCRRAARRAPDHDPGRLEPGRPGLRPARHPGHLDPREQPERGDHRARGRSGDRLRRG